MEAEISESRAKRRKVDKLGRFAALKKLKELKGSKNKYEVSQLDNVYEVVDEKEYNQKVLSRQDDDWIVDDDGSGYVEDGRDIFDDDLDSESIAASSKQSKTQSKKRKAISENAGKGNIQFMLSNMTSKKAEERNVEHDDVLSELLQDINETSTENTQSAKHTKTSSNLLDFEKQAAKDYMKSFAIPKPTKVKITPRKINRAVNNEKRIFKSDNILASSDVEMKTLELEKEKVENVQQISNSEAIINSNKVESKSGNGASKSITNTKQIFKLDNITSAKVESKLPTSRENINGGLQEDVLQELTETHGDASEDLSILQESLLLDDDFDMTNIEEYRDKPSSENKQHAEDVITEEQLLNGWNTMLKGSNNNDIVGDIKIDTSDLPVEVNNDGNKVFKFFWWDAFEDRKALPGVVFFFGKTFCESKKTYVSCCVAVRNIERKIFLLPRQYHKSDPSKPVTLLDVYKEFNKHVALDLKISNFKSKKAVKNYVFDPDVPTQSEYLEVRYSAKSSVIPSEYHSGETYSRIFGLNTSYLEIVLLDQNIRGPCWLEVLTPEAVTNPVTWCKLEVNCSKVSHLTVRDADKSPSPPPLVVASLNMRTIINQDSKHGVKNEIVMMSCLVQNKYGVDKQVPNPPFQQHFCVVARPDNMRLPLDFHNALKNYKATKVQKMESEKALLNYFIMQFANIDPDLIVGHDLQGYQLDLLCTRLRNCNVHAFSKLSRLKRGEFPQKGKFERELFCGRLVCDIKISAKELIRSRSFDLDTLCQKILKMEDDQRINLEPEDIPRMFQLSADIVKLITITMQDTAYILKMMYELNVIPLALQITNIAGNVMSRTLLGGRSERNEYLLMHAFAKKDYLVPDKVYEKKNVAVPDAQENSKSKRKKPTYSGGLVLDPKMGFYEQFILLMDFNSLYPSIIQEYNVCFTTIIHGDNNSCTFTTDKNKSTGILPTEIRKLVESRRQVKGLMKNPDLATELYMQYNIRQMALKLTANSMYGCLGFSNSRFFAKEIAAFVTQKGREILTNTKDTVEKMNYDVIYGDTDSIMINTNCLDYDEVFKIGNKIKQEINKLYRQVELDIDGVFKFLLLLKKKKYAAVTITKTKSGELKLAQEHKGLDIVRRDWSPLSAECGKAILNNILSADSLEEKIENVQNHLIKVKNDLENHTVPLTLLMITKQLTKNPKEYSDKNALPHVQVALRYNKKGGKQLQNGDTVPYIICDNGSNAAATQRAYHIEEFKNSDTLKLDVRYYLEQQIYPVISRLCEPIAGLDNYQIATWLGMDAKNFKKPKEKADEENLQYNDTIKYRNCEPFTFECYSCKTQNKVSEPIYNGFSFLSKCTNSQCSVCPIEYLPYISNQLTVAIHGYIRKFYKFEMTCEDPACINDDSFVAVNIVAKYTRCSTCKESIMYLKYSAQDLHMQLSYFQNLFQLSKGGKKLHVDTDTTHAYNSLRHVVDKVLSRSGFNKINLTEMFMPFVRCTNVQENELPEEDVGYFEPEENIDEDNI